MSEIKIECNKITVPLVSEEELKYIDNNFKSVIDEFLKKTIKDNDLLICQHIIDKLTQENKELKEINNYSKRTLFRMNKERLEANLRLVDEKKELENIIGKFEKWLEEEIKNNSFIIKGKKYINNANVIYQVVLNELQRIKGSELK